MGPLSGKQFICIVTLLLCSRFALAQTATVIQGNSSFATGGTNPSVSFPNNNTAGNLIWVAVGSDATITTPTDTAGNTYTLAISVTGANGSGNAAVYYAAAAVGGPNTVTCNHAGNGNTHCHIAEISGLVTSAVLDQTGSVASSSGCAVSTSAATTQSNEWVGAFFYDSPNNKTLIAGTGYTKVQLSTNSSSGDSALSESQNAGSTGVQTATCGGNSSNVLSQLITTFKASGAGSGPFISSLSPTTGAAGTSVTISGSSFGSSQGSSTVSFNGTIVTPAIWSSGSIQVSVPTGATTGNVVVTVGGTASNGVTFTVPPGPATVVQSKSGFATGGTNPSVTFPSKNTAGNLLWVAVGSDATITPPTDTLGNTYTLAVKAAGSGGSGNAAIYYASPARAGANTVTCNHSGNGDTHCHIAEVTGLVPFSPLDQTGSVASSAGCSVSTAAATTQANEWVAAFFYDSPTSTTMAAGAPYSKVQLSTDNSAGDSALSESQDVTATGVQTAACSGNSSNVLSQLITTFFAQSVPPSISTLSPTSGPVGASVTIAGGNFGNSQGSSTVTFNGVVATPTIWSNLSITVPVPNGATTGNVVVTVAGSASNGVNFTVTPAITSLSPNSGAVGATVLIAGTTFGSTQGSSTVTFNGVLATPTSWSSTIVQVPVPNGATTGNVVVTVAGNASNGVNFTVLPAITDFNPKSASVGALISVTGSSFNTGPGVPQVVLSSQSGGTIAAPVASFTATSLNFVIPDGAASGLITITFGTQTVTSAATLHIIPSSGFSLAVGPNSANLIQGQKVNFAVTLSSSNGFNQLAALSVSGVPSGVTSQFVPPQITAGQTSLLTLSAPAGQAVGPANLTITASATVNGIAVTQSANGSLNVQPVATTFIGRASVDDTLQTPLSGVTVTFMGQDGMGGTTSCSGQTQSDIAGNFSFANLPASCTGEQLIRYDGSTATTASDRSAGTPVQYAGVDLLYNIVANQVTTPPNVIRLPRIDNKETVMVAQNSSQDQTFTFKTIPNLSVIVYAGTTFTLGDGSHPDPFPLIAVDVPVDRLPDEMPNSGTNINAFIVAFQPANAVASQPVAVNFPNTLNTSPGVSLELDTLNPTIGMMVKYGTGTVSNDGTQIVPDFDPAHPNHRFGLVHFDWHGPQSQPGNQSNPAPPGGGTSAGNPPGGGTAAGGNTSPPTVQPASGDDGCNSCPCDPSQQTLLVAPASIETENLAQAGLADTDPGAEAGDPVDLFSGIQVIRDTDISISSPRGAISIVRTYRSLTNNPGPFGIGTNHNYGYQLGVFGFLQGQGMINLVTPDGNQFPFNQQSNGALANTTIPAVAGAVLSNPSSGVYNLRWKNGTVYQFQPSPQGPRVAFLTSITDANGNTISITQNPSVPGQVTQVTDPVGRSLTLAYDGSGRVSAITDPIGRTVQYTYNSQGSLASVTNPAGGVTQYTYDPQNRLLSVTDPRGIVQAQNTLDANGRVIQQVRPGGGGTLSFAYAPLNPDAPTSPIMFTRVTDSLGVSTGYRFNPQGFVAGLVSTQGQLRTIERASGTNQVLSVTEANSTAAFTYDANGNVLTSTDALGNTTTFTYEPLFNKVTATMDPLGNTTNFTYDSRGNRLTRTDVNGHTTSFAHNSFGQVIQITDPLGQKTALAYDNFGNPISTTDPLGNTTSIVYDAISRPVQTIDALGRRSQTVYDALDRVTKQVNAQGNSTQFAYDADGNLVSLTDANGHTTSFTYDSMNRLAIKTDPLGNTDTRTYDTNGNLTQFTDRRGQTSKFLYDSLNRLIESDYQDSTVTRSYDAQGRLVHVNDSASGEFDFSYDPAGRLLASVNPIGTVQYSYDADGRTTSRHVAGQPTLQYSYDPMGNLLSAALPQASASFAYDARNQISSISRANGVTSKYQFDPAGRLLSLVHSGRSGILNAQSYVYDAVGKRTSYSTNIAQPLSTQPVSSQFDAGNRLVQSSSPDGSTTYSYDATGNLVSSSGPSTGTTFSWDSRGRLQSLVQLSGQNTAFTYDFARNLISQTDSQPAGNLAKNFLLDNLTNIAYLSQSNGDNLSILAGQSIDDHLAVVHAGGQIEYGVTNAINSTVATTDQTGGTVSSFFYEPFGHSSSVSAYPFQYTGRVPVANQLLYYRARYYDASTGRFVSEDPLGFLGDVNLYRYVRNTPTNSLDPRGTRIVSVFPPGGDSSPVVLPPGPLPIISPFPLQPQPSLNIVAPPAPTPPIDDQGLISDDVEEMPGYLAKVAFCHEFGSVCRPVVGVGGIVLFCLSLGGDRLPPDRTPNQVPQLQPPVRPHLDYVNPGEPIN